MQTLRGMTNVLSCHQCNCKRTWVPTCELSKPSLFTPVLIPYSDSGRERIVGSMTVDPWASKAGGRGETRLPQSKNQRGRPPRNDDILASFFLDTDEYFTFSTIFKIKWPKSEEKLNFEGRWVWVSMNPSPPQQNFVATTLRRPFLLWSEFARRI